MAYSFRTSGNFVQFVYIESTPSSNPYYEAEHIVYALHNTSKCIDWSLPEDESVITFTIDENRYENIPLSSIDFDDVACSTQQDFIDGVQGMFENLAGGGGAVEGAATIYKAEVELTDAQIKALQQTYITVLAAPEAGKANMILSACLVFDTAAGAYTNIHSDSALLLAYGDWNDEVTNLIPMPSSADSGFGYNLGSKLGVDARVTWDSYLEGCSVYNDDVKIVGYNGDAGDLTGGNAANTLKVTVYYTIVDV